MARTRRSTIVSPVGAGHLAEDLRETAPPPEQSSPQKKFIAANLSVEHKGFVDYDDPFGPK
jgi:hypothetical protein